MGPSPVRELASGDRLSSARARTLEWVQMQQGGVTTDELAAAFGLHANTARGHLDSLASRGLLSTSQRPAVGRGRPATVYTAAAASQQEPDQRVREYAALAGTLANYLADTVPDPTAAGLAAGREWGRNLVVTTPRAKTKTPTGAATGVLRDLGFAPDFDRRNGVIRLTRCPLLDAAKRRPEIVCSVHRGLVEGLLEASGHTEVSVELIAFAEPGACILRLSQDDA